jgi:endoglucanase
MKSVLILSLGYLFSFPVQAQISLAANHFLVDRYGAIVRADTSKKTLALVFTGHQFADGGSFIRKTLKVKNVRGSFFFTGDFYANKKFSKLISQLHKDGHYLGAHSHHHLLYADWEKRDSTLVPEAVFKQDLQENYEIMSLFGIQKNNALYFLPPYEWYNADIATWTEELNLTLINFSPGTRSNADYTYPEMDARYVGSDAIYQSILNYEKRESLNGFILLVHIGTDPRRKDKLYNQLGKLIDELKIRGYSFQRIDDLLR